MTTATSKGARTKARILAAAGELFADRAFDAVSMRAIAQKARVDPALIHHYFDSKEGLFEAVVSAAIDPVQLEVKLERPRESWGRELVGALESLWSSPSAPALKAMARRALAGDPALMRDVMTRVLLERLAGHLPGTPEAARLRITLVASQMAGLVVTRHLLEMEPLVHLTSPQVVDLIGPTVQRYLTGELTD